MEKEENDQKLMSLSLKCMQSNCIKFHSVDRRIGAKTAFYDINISPGNRNKQTTNE